MESSTIAFGQQTQSGQVLSNNWQFGLNMGMLGYFGDVSTPKDLSSQLKNSVDFGFGGSLSKQISPLFGLKGDLLIGKLKGGNKTNLAFNSDLIETMINATLNFSELCWGAQHNQLINIYGVLGVGVSNFNGSTINTSTGAVIRSFGHHKGNGIGGYEIDGVGNIGLCLDLDLWKNVKATVESAFKFLSGDKLDGVVSGFKYDAYNYTSLGIAYTLPQTHKHKVKVSDNPILPPLLKPSAPEEKVKQEVTEQVTKNVDTIVQPVTVKADVNSQSPELVDSLANKIEKLMVKDSKKNEIPADRFRNEDNGDTKKSKLYSDNMDSYTGYKVQILASQKKMESQRVKAKYSFATNIRIDKANKLYHCSIGTFATFKEANKFSNSLHKKKGLQKTFVVYFLNGKRVGPVKK